jgi:hypothetical protein
MMALLLKSLYQSVIDDSAVSVQVNGESRRYQGGSARHAGFHLPQQFTSAWNTAQDSVAQPVFGFPEVIDLLEHLQLGREHPYAIRRAFDARPAQDWLLA